MAPNPIRSILQWTAGTILVGGGLYALALVAPLAAVALLGVGVLVVALGHVYSHAASQPGASAGSAAGATLAVLIVLIVGLAIVATR